MNTLIKSFTDKEEAIKEINKFRLENKGSWYKCEIKISDYTYLLKTYGTWVQICYVFKNGAQLYKDSGGMDISVKEFKQYLNKLIK